MVFRVSRLAQFFRDLPYCRLGLCRVLDSQVLAVENLNSREGRFDVLLAHADQHRDDNYPGAQGMAPQQDRRFLADPVRCQRLLGQQEHGACAFGQPPVQLRTPQVAGPNAFFVQQDLVGVRFAPQDFG